MIFFGLTDYAGREVAYRGYARQAHRTPKKGAWSNARSITWPVYLRWSPCRRHVRRSSCSKWPTKCDVQPETPIGAVVDAASIYAAREGGGPILRVRLTMALHVSTGITAAFLPRALTLDALAVRTLRRALTRAS